MTGTCQDKSEGQNLARSLSLADKTHSQYQCESSKLSVYHKYQYCVFPAIVKSYCKLSFSNQGKIFLLDIFLLQSEIRELLVECSGTTVNLKDLIARLPDKYRDLNHQTYYYAVKSLFPLAKTSKG